MLLRIWIDLWILALSFCMYTVCVLLDQNMQKPFKNTMWVKVKKITFHYTDTFSYSSSTITYVIVIGVITLYS